MKGFVMRILVLLSLLAFQAISSAAVMALTNRYTGQVHDLTLSPFYVTSIHIASNQSIRSIHCGDPAAWEISRSAVAKNTILIKPKRQASTTNLLVYCGEKPVYFKIHATVTQSIDPLVLVNLRFLARKSLKKIKHQRAIHPYCFHGDESLRPLWMYDDGEYTYFSWPKQAALPAIYRISPDRKQSYISSYRIHHRIIWLPKANSQWVLKRGSRTAILLRLRYRNGRSYCHA